MLASTLVALDQHELTSVQVLLILAIAGLIAVALECARPGWRK